MFSESFIVLCFNCYAAIVAGTSGLVPTSLQLFATERCLRVPRKNNTRDGRPETRDKEAPRPVFTLPILLSTIDDIIVRRSRTRRFLDPLFRRSRIR